MPGFLRNFWTESYSLQKIRVPPGAMPTVFVIGDDWHLRANVRAELREQGIEALGMETLDAAEQALAQGSVPDAIVADASSGRIDGTRLAALARHAPLIVVATRTAAAPASDSAAAILWRPVSVGEVVEQILHFLKGQAV
jgi:DNA-binding response OmpR family regulator